MASAPVAEKCRPSPDGRGIVRLPSVSLRGREIMRILKAFLADNRGATAIEYGLIAALICGALVSGLGVFTGALQDVFNVINNNMTVN
jgi:pilus assembly protein Flp/PilA